MTSAFVCRSIHYLGLIVVLNAHCEDIDADDEGDEEIQVVAGAQCVDGQTYRRIVRIVWPLLGLWRSQTHKQDTDTWRGRQITVSDCALKWKYYLLSSVHR